jgi:hypothetical protein
MSTIAQGGGYVKYNIAKAFEEYKRTKPLTMQRMEADDSAHVD